MTAPIEARIDLDKLDLDRVETTEIVVPDTSPEVVLSVTRFGLGDLTLVGTNPDHLEAVGEALLDAARNLRYVVDGHAEDLDLDAFPKAG